MTFQEPFATQQKIQTCINGRYIQVLIPRTYKEIVKLRNKTKRDGAKNRKNRLQYIAHAFDKENNGGLR